MSPGLMNYSWLRPLFSTISILHLAGKIWRKLLSLISSKQILTQIAMASLYHGNNGRPRRNKFGNVGSMMPGELPAKQVKFLAIAQKNA